MGRSPPHLPWPARHHGNPTLQSSRASFCQLTCLYRISPFLVFCFLACLSWGWLGAGRGACAFFCCCWPDGAPAEAAAQAPDAGKQGAPVLPNDAPPRHPRGAHYIPTLNVTVAVVIAYRTLNDISVYDRQARIAEEPSFSFSAQ